MENTSIKKIYKDKEFKRFSFLIVDDSSFMRKNVARIINLLDGDVVGEAENGDMAVSQFQKHNPDIVTMDITMPGMNGITAVQEIMKKNPSAIIVMLSALGHKDKVKDAIKSGAKHFIVKPFKLNEAAAILQSVIKKNYTGWVEK